MRKLYVKRQRALACFSVTYHCILGQSQEDHLRWVREQSRPELMRSREPGGMRNGETICLELGEGPSSIFVIAYLEQRDLMTRLLPIPAGTEDLLCTVVTQYDGNRRLALELVPGDPDAPTAE